MNEEFIPPENETWIECMQHANGYSPFYPRIHYRGLEIDYLSHPKKNDSHYTVFLQPERLPYIAYTCTNIATILESYGFPAEKYFRFVEKDFESYGTLRDKDTIETCYPIESLNKDLLEFLSKNFSEESNKWAIEEKKFARFDDGFIQIGFTLDKNKNYLDNAINNETISNDMYTIDFVPWSVYYHITGD